MPHKNTHSSADWLELVRQKVESLRFGAIQIKVYKSKVIDYAAAEQSRACTFDSAVMASVSTSRLSDFVRWGRQGSRAV